MRIVHCILTCSVLCPNFRGAAGMTFSKSILSTARSDIVEAAEIIPVPSDGIADPHKILNDSMKEELAAKIHQYASFLTIDHEGSVAVASTRKRSFEDGDVETINSGFPVQIAVAVVEGIEVMNREEFDSPKDIEELAGQFAMSLHNKWGVGHEIVPSTENKKNGGTGVLVFLSVRDRVVFISVGGALDHLLTSGRIERIINNDMKADLKRANYGLGLAKGIEAIVEILERNEEPSVIEMICENMSVIIAFVCVGFAILRERKRQREQRVYAKVAVQLSELDRARAEALRGSYQRTTSCPICLEGFSSETLGSDGRPIQLLRCGHVFDKTCYEEWISSGHGDVTKCPVCRADVGTCCQNPTSRSSVDNQTFASIARSEGQDDTNDRSRINDDDLQIIDTDHNDAASLVEDDSSNVDSFPTGARINRLMLRYQADRNFRLERLSELYPRYVTPDFVTRWCSSSFNGSLASDPSFRNRDPETTTNQNQRYSSASNSSGSYDRSTFGGGTSAGGTAGRF